MLTSDYVSRIENLAFHDLTDGKIMPPSTADLLGQGLSFIPKPTRTTGYNDLTKCIMRFRRDMYLRAHFAQGSLADLAKEKIDEDEGNNKSKLYLKSEWTPESAPSQVDSRLFKFVDELSKIFKSKGTVSNLRSHEQQLLESLRANEMLIIAAADKNLGPCAVTLIQYIRDALKHLGDKSTYEILNETEARSKLLEISLSIDDWLVKYGPTRREQMRDKEPNPNAGAVSENDRNYIQVKKRESWNNDPYSYFYLLYKVHKSPLKTRPVVSTCGCVSYGIAQWVDVMLQPIAKAQQSYFKDSRALKLLLDDLHIPSNVSVFSFDAVSMYSNIDSKACLEVMADYLRKEETRKRFPHYNPDALIDAIEIVLRSNVMKFGDIFIRQITGVAMGINPAPALATIFFALREDFVFNKWKHCIFFNRRFIDDGLAFWIHQLSLEEDERCWKEFQADINDYYGLTWTFTPRSQSVDFMDMTIHIQDNRIVTDLFEKDLALDVRRHIKDFHDRLIRRGYLHTDLLPLFEKAAKNAEVFLQKSEEEKATEKRLKQDDNKKRIFFHLKYHPDDPPSSAIQKIFRECILHPPGEKPFYELENHAGIKIPLERLTVCYSTHPNLGSIFSYRKICKRKDMKVSTLLHAQDNEQA